MKAYWKKGYTLVEVMVVTAIMAVVIVGGVAGYNRNNERQRVRQAADDLITQLRVVQKRADAGETVSGCVGTFNGYQLIINISASNNTIQVLADCNDPNPPAGSIVLKNGAVFTANRNFRFLSLGRGVSPTSTQTIRVRNAANTVFVNVCVEAGGVILTRGTAAC
jgi:prepilin-type N-terminal cleavage/methylation domain-containing protein